MSKRTEMQSFPKRTTLTLTLAIIAVLVIGNELALQTTKIVIRNVGTIKTLGVGVYRDENCTNILTSFDWGIIGPGSVKNDTAYVRNEGNAEAKFFLETTNWDPPEASKYITLSWDYVNQTISPNEAVQVTFTLTVAANITGITNFNFDIIIGSS